ncbi:MAG: metallophosphoesterase [Nanoarchaeota archaeon]
MDNKKFIEEMFIRGILIQEDVLSKGAAQKELEESLVEKIAREEDLIILNSDYAQIISTQSHLVDWYELDKFKVEAEKERNEELYQSQLQKFTSSYVSLKGGSNCINNNRNHNNHNPLNHNPLNHNPLNHGNMLLQGSLLQKQKITAIKVEMKEGAGSTVFATGSSELVPEPLLSTVTAALTADSFSKECISKESIKESADIITESVDIIECFENKPHKYEVKDFTYLFLSRHKFLEGILRRHQELQNATPLIRILSKKEKEAVAFIGMVSEISITKNGNMMLSVEDPTASISVFVSKNNSELFAQARDLVHDEVVGICGLLGDKIIFAEKIIWPDILSSDSVKKSDVEEYALFLSDTHVGSSVFLKEEFTHFLDWINGKTGDERQKDIAGKVKYILIAGDLVDGVGVYPSQSEELEIKDVVAQYDEFCSLIKQIPSSKRIIVCPGNHDAIHLAEPQTSFDVKFAPQLFELPNVKLVTNPAVVNIGRTSSFPGFNVLLYHGYSFDHYVSSVESIRSGGGYHRADLIMKFLLKRRHLAPSFSSTPYFPVHKEDPLLIKTIPDFFISGHIHYSNIAAYKGVITISGSCWQGRTAFQEKLGHEPEPARVPIVNLKTREIKILKFI